MHSKVLYITSLLLFILNASAQDVSFSGDTTTIIDTTYTDVNITTLLSSVAYTTTITPCTPAQPLFPNGGTEFLKTDDSFQYHCFPISVPIGNNKVDCVYIYVNGIISTSPTFTYNARTLKESDVYTFAPFWTDIDIRVAGTVDYREIEKYPVNGNRDDATSLNNFIKEKGKLQSFDTVYALIVTWTGVLPHLAKTQDKSATFQFILATDGTFTYAVYIYDTCNMSWDFTFDVLMGHAASTTNVYNNINSLSDTIITDSLIPGNNGEGTWVFLVSSDSPENFKLECLKWHWDEKALQPLTNTDMPQCSCNVNIIRNFEKFKLHSTTNCYQLVMESNSQGKACCYDQRTLVRGNVERNIFASDKWFAEDTEPYRYCCLESQYCNIFYEHRPKDDCSLWKQDPTGVMFGDPHFKTLDGLNYTFNGVGEYELLNVFNSTDNSSVMRIQCRTRKIGSGSASVFEAFAFKTPETQVQIMTTLNYKAVVLRAGDRELTQFKSSNLRGNFSLRENGVFIELSRDEKDYLITFSNGVSAKITFENEILQFTLTVPTNWPSVYTNGLLGTYNGNISDDFQLRDNSYIPIDSTEETIYYTFGDSWLTDETIFQYENGKNLSNSQDRNFKPTFWSSNFTTNSTVNKFCEGVKTCIYDYLQMKNEDVARTTLEISNEISYLSLLEKYPIPVINGSRNAFLSYNETLDLEFNIIYKDYNISLKVIESNSSTIILANDTVMVKLFAGVTNISAVFQIISDIGHESAIVKLNIIVCPQCVNGTCNAEAQFNNLSRSSQYLACTCNQGWDGDDCSVDNRCAPFPCTNASTLERCFCDCPEGYEYKDDKCVEINECSEQSPCEQLCTNTRGSYVCACKPGYIRNDKNCTDIDECKTQHDCQHICKNTNGSFDCTCFSGYTLNPDGKTCNKTAALNCSICSAYDGCKINATSNETMCFCNSGYDKNSTGCFDTNECEKSPGICGNARCNNTESSYECLCDDGYYYDKSENNCTECPPKKYGEKCSKTCNPSCASCDKKKGCVCEKGKTGDTCSDDIDECKQINDCDVNTTICQNAYGSYFCKCKAGYKKQSDITCKDIDECASRENNNCSENAICTNTIGSYKCTCKGGFKGDGLNCADIDECAIKNDCEHKCNNTIGSYSCLCKEGYYIADDRISCVYFGEDKCKTNRNNCAKDATCSSSNENYTCTCNDGFEGDGFTCIDEDKCKTNRHNCSKDATCSSSNENYNCTCNDGFEGDGFNCTAIEYFDEQLIYIIVGVILGLLVWLLLMVFCVWCCCFGGYVRYRSRHETLTSTLEQDPYRVRQGFGSLSSSFTGRGRGRYYFGKFLGTKYLRNWAEFSPDAGDDPIPGTSGISVNEQSLNDRSARWENVLEKVNRTTEVFHIDRPEISRRSYQI